ncbi:hypothetical protein [Sphingopyxis sp. QXT-31]|uniref:hypothetical protein n=1 Tax=Sphingopyxis sp. QXT-31 TaxID=1357916 RepID=UPI0012EB9E08|nr:hypothetical protein [Sphingopyxis sp. QXT-31]
MKNTQEILEVLHPSQRTRLGSLFGSRQALPWEEGDDELSGLGLVHIRHPERGEETTELNNRGWSVAMLINDGRGEPAPR